MDFGNDQKTLSIGDQFMAGPALMVCPVYSFKERKRDVYLPEGSDWYDLLSGKYFAGGQTYEVDAPLNKVPVFVKSGSIVPVGPDIQYTSEKPSDPTRLYIYTGQDGSFTLYDDEGVNYNYEQGKYATIPLAYNDEDGTLTIGARTGSYSGMLEARTFELKWIGKDEPEGIMTQSKPDKVVQYTGQEVIVKRGDM
jgi:alpha-D-xyloside xylohydrolase